MTQNKKVKTIEEEGQTSKGTPYWKIIWEDGKSDMCFNPEWIELLERAKKEGIVVNIEKEKNGNYWNIKDLSLGEVQAEAPKRPVQTVIPTSDSKNRAFALSYAKDLMVALINTGKLEAKIVPTTLAYAREFERYLNGDQEPDKIPD